MDGFLEVFQIIDGVLFLLVCLLELLVLGLVAHFPARGTHVGLSGNARDTLGVWGSRLLAPAIGKTKVAPGKRKKEKEMLY